MRSPIIFLFVILLSPQLGTFAQSKSDASPELIHQNPHSWFALQLPSDIRRLEGPVDVDGGRYQSADLEIHFDYWTYQNTPNWLLGEYATSLMLACPGKNALTHTRRTWVDGKRAVVQQCSLQMQQKAFAMSITSPFRS